MPEQNKTTAATKTSTTILNSLNKNGFAVMTVDSRLLVLQLYHGFAVVLVTIVVTVTVPLTSDSGNDCEILVIVALPLLHWILLLVVVST